MSKAILVLEDAADGQIASLLTHVEGFNDQSAAHKLSIQIIKFLDSNCVRKEVQDTNAVTKEERAFARRVGEPLILTR